MKSKDFMKILVFVWLELVMWYFILAFMFLFVEAIGIFYFDADLFGMLETIEGRN